MSTLSFPILAAQRYQDATNRAKALIREQTEAPQWATFEPKDAHAHPRWFTGLVIAALVAVMVFSLTISAGKQIASASMLFDPLPDKFRFLSMLWSSTSIAFMLLLSEFGSATK